MRWIQSLNHGLTWGLWKVPQECRAAWWMAPLFTPFSLRGGTNTTCKQQQKCREAPLDTSKNQFVGTAIKVTLSKKRNKSSDLNLLTYAVLVSCNVSLSSFEAIVTIVSWLSLCSKAQDWPDSNIASSLLSLQSKSVGVLLLHRRSLVRPQPNECLS